MPAAKPSTTTRSPSRRMPPGMMALAVFVVLEAIALGVVVWLTLRGPGSP